MENRFEAGLAFSVNIWPLNPQKSTLVFIHGSGGSSILWDNQLKTFGDRANLMALDLPGHGRSPGKSFNTVTDYTKSVIDFLNQLKVPRPIPAGLSLGGAIVLQLLLDHSESFSAGALICTGAKLKVLPAIFETIKNNFPAFNEMKKKMALSPKTDPALVQPLWENDQNTSPQVSFDDFEACDRFDVRDRLSEIKVPVLVVSGQDDQLTPPKYAEYLAEKIAGAKRAHVMDAGHLLPVEKPEELNQALRAFLDETGL